MKFVIQLKFTTTSATDT